MSARLFNLADFKNRGPFGRFVAGNPWPGQQYTTVPVAGLEALIEVAEKAQEVVRCYRESDEIRWADICDAVDAFEPPAEPES